MYMFMHIYMYIYIEREIWEVSVVVTLIICCVVDVYLLIDYDHVFVDVSCYFFLLP